MKKESSCQADVPQGTRLLFLSTPPVLFWMQGLCGNGQIIPTSYTPICNTRKNWFDWDTGTAQSNQRKLK